MRFDGDVIKPEVERLALAILKYVKDSNMLMGEIDQSSLTAPLDDGLHLDAGEMAQVLMKSTIRSSELEGLVKEAYMLGFQSSQEGFNGEYRTREPLDDPHWIEQRNSDVAGLLKS